jgi:hypothetical protein
MNYPGENGEPVPPFKMPSLPAALAAARLDWRNYSDPSASYFDHIAGLVGSPSKVKAVQFDADVAKGYLPAVPWLYPPSGLSEHPSFAKNPSPWSRLDSSGPRPHQGHRRKPSVRKHRGLRHLGWLGWLV